MPGAARVVLTLALLLRPAAAGALHDPDVTDDERRCQIGTSMAQSAYTTEKSKCVIQCQQRARRRKQSAEECAPPYAGATAACIAAVTQRAIDRELRRCRKDCPECYSGGNCPRDAGERTADTATRSDQFAPVLFCDDARSSDGLTAAELRCQSAVTAALTRFVDQKLRCFARCRKDEQRGKVELGACNAHPSDARTAACIAASEAKAAALIDRKCEAGGGDRPECYGANHGAAWVGVVSPVVDLSEQEYCGSPSGAFIGR